MKTSRIKGFLATIATTFLFYPVVGSSANWEHVAISSDKITTVEIDSESLAKKGARTKAWFRLSYSAEQKFVYPHPKATEKYTLVLSLTYFNCAEKTTSDAQQLYRTDDGTVVYSWTHPNPDTLSLYDVAPETLGEAMLKAACAPRKPAAP